MRTAEEILDSFGKDIGKQQVLEAMHIYAQELIASRDSRMLSAVPSEEIERLELAIELMDRAGELLTFLEWFKTPNNKLPERTRCVARLMHDFRYISVDKIKRGIAG